MGFARIYSAQPAYLSASLVTVEADLSRGLHSFQVVGLADKAIEESRERVAAAVKNSGFASPKHTSKRVLISLAPADLKKEGPSFDLPIALAYLLATGEVTFDSNRILFLGELSLQGELRTVRGVLSIAKYAHAHGFHTVVVPAGNAAEAALIEGITILPAPSLSAVVAHFDKSGARTNAPITPQATTVYAEAPGEEVDLADIRGQETAKRGLEIAAAGRHNIVLYGPPGTGKTMLARALRGILPPLTFEEALEATAIHSLAGTLCGTLLSIPPFRAPHHSASHTAIVGGGTIPRPGEATLAHRGVLFLDEFPEFERRVIDGLREPLEDKVITVSRAKGSVTFPAQFILVAAMNPNRERTDERIQEVDRERLKKKISGPIIDRIDLWIEVAHVEHETLRTREPLPPRSPAVRERVGNARTLQHARYHDTTKANADMTVRDIDGSARLTRDAEDTLTRAAGSLHLSPRSYHRAIKLSRTIADLACSETIAQEHMLEALSYRPRGLFE